MTTDAEHRAKTYDSVRAEARPGATFSNGSEWDAWAALHCYVCARDGATETGCVITGVAMLEHVTPVEWVETHPGALGDRYTCTDFVRAPDVPPGPARLEVGPMRMVMPQPDLLTALQDSVDRARAARHDGEKGGA